jgi:hypothetical protein
MKSKILFSIIVVSCGVLILSALVGWMKGPLLLNPADLRRSATKSLLLLQKSGSTFIDQSRRKCASCHHNVLTSMAAEIGRQKGIPVIDSLCAKNVRAIEKSLITEADPNQIIEFLPNNFNAPYLLLGLFAEKYPPNFYTDLAVDYIMSQEKPGGGFLTESTRVPLECGETHLTALAVRAVQEYAPPAEKDRVNELVTRSRLWLEKENPGQQQELAFQLLGMQWCGSSTDLKIRVAGKLRAMQNSDGGWSQLPSLKSDAYATGQTLYAFYISGMAKTKDELYQKGLNYLLKTQDESGAWIVETRAYPIQPFFNSEFPPYDENQFISAAASNWATMAILNALPDISHGDAVIGIK